MDMSTPTAAVVPHVYTGINAVQLAMSAKGIAKNRNNTQGAGFKFRGIDDVLNALSSTLAENKLAILPKVLSRECTERASKSGGALFYVVIQVDFDIVSSIDGSRHTVSTFGEAMDSSDKATNKAMSAAYKYMALQSFCIPTEGDNDADGSSHDVAHVDEELAAKLRAVSSVSKLVEIFDAMTEEQRRTAKPLFAKQRKAIQDADGIL